MKWNALPYSNLTKRLVYITGLMRGEPLIMQEQVMENKEPNRKVGKCTDACNRFVISFSSSEICSGPANSAAPQCDHIGLMWAENGCQLTHVARVADTCGCRYTPGTWSAAGRVADARNLTPAAADAAPLSRCWWGCDADEMRPSSTCRINRHYYRHWDVFLCEIFAHNVENTGKYYEFTTDGQ